MSTTELVRGRCRKCRAKLAVPIHWAGKKLSCPQCHNPFRAPHTPSADARAPVPQGSPASDPRGTGWRAAKSDDQVESKQTTWPTAPALPAAVVGPPPPPPRTIPNDAVFLPPGTLCPAVDGRPYGTADHRPLQDAELSRLRQCERDRRVIRQAATLYRLLSLLDVGMLVILIVFSLAMMIDPPQQARVPALLILSLMAGYGMHAALYYTAYYFTWRCHLWAPLVVLVLNALGTVGICVLMLSVSIAAPRSSTSVPFHVAMFLAALAIPVIVTVVSALACNAIPRFLRQPAWCQNTLLYLGL